jgi:hypothetical protein
MRRKPILLLLVFVVLVAALSVFLIVRRGVNADTVASNVTVYKVSPFDKIMPTTAMKGQPTKDMTVELYKGENGIFSIAVKNNNSVGINLTIKGSGLNVNKSTTSQTSTSSSATLVPFASMIDTRVVNIWEQKIITWNFPRTTKAEQVPELLVKSDKRDYTKISVDLVKDANLVNVGSLTDNLPSVTQDQPVDTFIKPNTVKQFTFKVNKMPNAGKIGNVIEFVNQASNVTVSSVNVTYNVSDIALKQPSDLGYNIGCYYNDVLAFRKTISVDRFGGSNFDRLDPYYLNPSGSKNDMELLKSRLKTIKDYGCESLRIFADPYTDTLDGISFTAKYVETIQSLGFKGPIFILFGRDDTLHDQNITISDPENDSADRWISPMANLKKLVKAVKEINTQNLPIVMYGVDEANSDAKYSDHKLKMDNIRQAISEVDKENSSLASRYPLASSLGTTSVWTKMLQKLDKEKYLPEYPYQNIQSPLVTPITSTNFVNDFIKNAAYRTNVYKNEGYYLQGFNEDPAINRFLGGLFLTGTNMKGYMINNIYAYGGLAPSNWSKLDKRELSRKIYDDFFAGVGDYTQKRLNIFYPSKEGFIPTIQAEAWREAVMDIRVYLTVKVKANTAIKKCPKQKLESYPSKIQAIQNQYKTSDPKFGYSSIPLTIAQMDKNRATLDQYLREIKAACPQAF